MEIQNRQWTNIEGPLFDGFKPGEVVAVAPARRESVPILMQAECLAWQEVKGKFGADERRHCANGGEYEERDLANMENTEERCIRGILAGQSIELWE
ncbi:hypothetical protein N7491_001783 [Penicillium cf. griseofulvum]|uniref:Uncharacterized protein n=1 Tax=Penicillium cf. griseofulvum TaxID=2972120 RepID=A0A9W9JGD1_9EURO|nr:hypothetical protein N7472_006911 [Penicillium cf. griseofulvum]KAJ5445701.1 hypothetical protein N7491_001783 [Penicillium cf. griseofulvum]KAJ5447423.1 hypothetical protein N7445_002244 [Penicillium cf. griseofulvum]